MNEPGADQPRARNRGAPTTLDDALMSTVRDRYEMADPLSYARSLGPWRTPINLEDVGWEASVDRYRRLGGDIVFNEANRHDQSAADYSSELLPGSEVDVSNPDWYFDMQRRMGSRFVGGRSNSTLGYMLAATALYHANKMELGECEDLVAFVVADMVVSGEHSMPEAMTTVVMVAENTEPWNQTDVKLTAPAQTIAVWLKLVDDPTQGRMNVHARQSLEAVLGMAAWDYALIKILVALRKILYNAA